MSRSVGVGVSFCGRECLFMWWGGSLSVGGGWRRGLVAQIHAFRAFMANGGKFEMGNVHLVVIPQPMEEGREVAHIVTSLPA